MCFERCGVERRHSGDKKESKMRRSKGKEPGRIAEGKVYISS